jgi:diadenosine tetraphosphate (Ap4A) HIT family hydrolase
LRSLALRLSALVSSDSLTGVTIDQCLPTGHHWSLHQANRTDFRDAPGTQIVVNKWPFDFTPQEWAATHDLLLKAKAAQDERLAPDGYMLVWNCFSEPGQPPHHAHLHVIPRFDDEPFADRGGRSAIKRPENRRPDPFRRGSGRAQSFGRRSPG